MITVQYAEMKKKFTELYNSATAEPAFLNVPAMNFLMLDGIGDPKGNPDYRGAVNALVAVSYATMFMLKREKQIKDFGVPPVESIWLLDANSDFDGMDNKEWRWTAMIMQPDHVVKEDIERAIMDINATHPNPIYEKIRFERFDKRDSHCHMLTTGVISKTTDVGGAHGRIRECKRLRNAYAAP